MSMITGTAVGTIEVQPQGITSQPMILTAALTFAAGLIAFVILKITNAVPFPLLLIVVNLLACFAGGLVMRALWAEHKQLRGRAMLLAAVIAPLSTTLGMLVGVIVTAGFAPIGGMFSGDVSSALAPQVLLLQGATTVTLLGGAAVGAFAAVANIPYIFLGLPLALYFTWIIAPMIATVYISMTRWEGVGLLNQTPMVGLENYERLFNDKNFWIALSNNVKWLLFFLVIPTSMGLGLAMIFNTSFPGARLFKIAFFAPLIIAPTVVGIVWSALYLPETGLINSFLRSILGPEVTLPGWLADPNLVLWCIIFAAGWRQVGYVMILYLAGLKSLDVSLLEAAIVDGASPWERFWFVIFPLLGPVTVVVVVISVIDSLRAFDLVAIMTRGGPAYSSEVLANFMYISAFNNYKMGYAGAIAVVLLVLMLFFIVPYLVRIARTELEY